MAPITPSNKDLSRKSSKAVTMSRSKGSVSQKSMAGINSDEELNVREKRLTRMASTALRKFDKKGLSNFSRLAQGVASKMLHAYLGFKDPKRRRREYLIPKDKAAWLEWLVYVARKRVTVEYLTDKELRKVIIRARPNLSPYKKTHEPVEDPDVPPCLTWNERQVGEWISSIGWPQLRETFVRNIITGRRLVLIDCTALNRMGMTDLASMREVAGKIRQLLGTPPPNALRPIMRIAPYERFLHRKVYNGRNYDDITFEKFCDMEGFNYELLTGNKNAQIPCTCEVLITTPEQAEAEDEEGEEDEEERSLKNAPTVEYLVRNAIIRNRTVDQILKDILENVFLPPRERKYGKEVWGQLKRGIGEGYDDLHLYYPKDRLEFASGVAHHLIDELYKTVGILNDISQLEKHIKEDISPEQMKIFQDGAMALLEQAAPIAALLALGELDLESIFRKEPTFELYVNEVVREAEKRTNDLVPDASSFVDDVISEAWRKIPDMDLTGLGPDLRHSILRMANEILYGITEEKNDIIEIVKNSAAGGAGKRGDLGSPASPKGITKGKEIKPVIKPPPPTKKKPSLPTGQKETAPAKPEGQGQETGDEASPSSESAPHQSQPAAPHKPPVGGVGVKPPGPPGTGESGSGSDNKDADAKGKAATKGKKDTKDKHPPPADKDGKTKKEELVPSSGGGEGEGVASAVASDILTEEQNYTVQTAEISLDQSLPATPLRLTTADRRDSPLLRSPMTVSTPTGDFVRNAPIPRTPMTLGSAGRRHTGEDSESSFDGSFEGNEMPHDKTEMVPHVNVAIVRPKGPPMEKRSLYQPYKKTKVLRMSKDQDRMIKPLIEAASGDEKRPLIDIHGQGPLSEMVSIRQGKDLPPAQIIYNQKEQILLQQQQRLLQAKEQGQKLPKPAAYHERRGILTTTGADKEAAARRESLLEESVPAFHKRLDNVKEVTPKAEKKSNFVVIPKALIQKQQQEAIKDLPPDLSIALKKPPPPPPPRSAPPNQIQLQAMTSAISTPSVPNIGVGKGTSSKERARRESSISESAQEIWKQMKEQYEHEKKKSNAQKEEAKAKSKESVKEKGENVEEEEEEEETEARTLGDSHQVPERLRKPNRFAHQAQSHALIIDHAHVMEMKEHRDTIVEDWAKKHSILDPADPNMDKDERTRLVRMTADKVVTEICTMALTHMLLEAETGKSTQRIMDALKKLQVKTDIHEGDVTLWNPEIGKTRSQAKKQEEQLLANLAASTATEGTPSQGRKSYQGDGQTDQKKSIGFTEQPQQTDSSKLTERQPPRSILHIPGSSSATGPDGAADKLKAQAKSVVVNAVKGAYEDTGKNKPLTRSTTSTAVRKDQYVTRL